MILREFLKKIAPDMRVVMYDIYQYGFKREEDNAGALADARRFDYSSVVVDLSIEPEQITIYYQR